jgi:hypothetical protein
MGFDLVHVALPFWLGGTTCTTSITGGEPLIDLTRQEDNFASTKATTGNLALPCPFQERDVMQP